MSIMKTYPLTCFIKKSEKSIRDVGLGKSGIRCLSSHTDIEFLRQASEVDERIAHSSKCSVDADPSCVGNILEAESLIESHEHYFPLVGREFLDECLHVLQHLLVDDFFLPAVFERNIGIIEQVVFSLIVGKDHQRLVLPVVIDNEVVGYSHHPRCKLPILGVESGMQLGDDAHKAILEEIQERVESNVIAI